MHIYKRKTSVKGERQVGDASRGQAERMLPAPFQSRSKSAQQWPAATCGLLELRTPTRDLGWGSRRFQLLISAAEGAVS